jgi:hypothetical protein
MNTEGVACILLGIVLFAAVIVDTMRAVHKLYQTNGDHSPNERENGWYPS